MPFWRNGNKIKITALGGVDVIGEKNCVLLTYGREGILLDCGQSVPSSRDETEGGIMGNREIYPDFSAIGKDVSIKAVLISHGHLDHIGGLVDFVPQQPEVSVVGSRFSLNLIHSKIFSKNFGMFSGDASDILSAGPFSIYRFPVLHSIPGASGFAIRLRDDKGKFFGPKVVYTGDIKTPGDVSGMSPKRAERYGRYWNALKAASSIFERDGADYLIHDATNILEEGYAGIEEDVYPSLNGIISHSSGRVYIALISSNVARLRSIVNIARRNGRMVYVAGSAIKEILAIAGIRSWEPLDSFSAQYLPRDAVIICTGSQAEENSFLDKIAKEELDYPLSVSARDTLVISSDTIPKEQIWERFRVMVGHLRQIFGRICLTRYTPDIEGDSGGIIDRVDNLHVSGHGKREDDRRILEELHPRILIPFHADRERREEAASYAKQNFDIESLILETGKSEIL